MLVLLGSSNQCLEEFFFYQLQSVIGTWEIPIKNEPESLQVALNAFGLSRKSLLRYFSTDTFSNNDIINLSPQSIPTHLIKFFFFSSITFFFQQCKIKSSNNLVSWEQEYTAVCDSADPCMHYKPERKVYRKNSKMCFWVNESLKLVFVTNFTVPAHLTSVFSKYILPDCQNIKYEFQEIGSW